MSLVTLALVCIVLASIWVYSKWRHNYWASRGVPTPPYLPVFGHIHHSLSGKGKWVHDTVSYHRYGGSRYCGLYEFFSPVLMVGDPELIKHIFVKDFDHFVDRMRMEFPNESDRVMAEMLSIKTGEDWKQLRAIMTPTFTSGKMKGMFPLVCDKADDLVSFCLNEAKRKPFIDMKHNFGRFTVDTIASCAFGLECNSLVDEKAEFPKKAETFFFATHFDIAKFILMMTMPTLNRIFKLRLSSPESEFFEEVVMHTLNERLKGEKRGDFLDILLEARDPDASSQKAGKDINSDSISKAKYMLNDTTITAQSILFIVAGYETTASTLGFASFLLAKNPDVQQKLREEIQELVHEEGDITYQGIMEAKFLDATLMETLRLYPPAPFLERLCTKEYRLPGTDVILRAGQRVQCPVWGIHHDPKWWPQPDEFRPERFLPENKSHIKNFTHMPFGIGPRNCIGMRFALMEAKVVLSKVLLAAELQLASGYEELQLEPGLGLLRAKGGVQIVFKPL